MKNYRKFSFPKIISVLAVFVCTIPGQSFALFRPGLHLIFAGALMRNSFDMPAESSAGKFSDTLTQYRVEGHLGYATRYHLFLGGFVSYDNTFEDADGLGSAIAGRLTLAPEIGFTYRWFFLSTGILVYGSGGELHAGKINIGSLKNSLGYNGFLINAGVILPVHRNVGVGLALSYHREDMKVDYKLSGDTTIERDLTRSMVIPKIFIDFAL